MCNKRIGYRLFGLALAFLPAAAAAQPSETDGRWRIDTGSKWEEMAAYSRAVVDGRWIFVSGTVGFDPVDGSIPTSFGAQMDQIFANIEATLARADAELKDIVRVRSYIVDRKHVDVMAAKLKAYLDEVRPTNTTIVTELAAEGALVELEVTALKRRAKPE